MKKIFFLLALGVVLTGVSASGLAAQKLEVGAWTGTGVGPSGEAADVSFDVRMNGDTLMIDLNGPDGQSMPLTDIRFEEGKLLFTWEPGVVVKCVLSPVEGGGYDGPCTDENGGSGRLTMVPPKH
jgi:hypothetical protein